MCVSRGSLVQFFFFLFNPLKNLYLRHILTVWFKVHNAGSQRLQTNKQTHGPYNGPNGFKCERSERNVMWLTLCSLLPVCFLLQKPDWLAGWPPGHLVSLLFSPAHTYTLSLHSHTHCIHTDVLITTHTNLWFHYFISLNHSTAS